MLFALEVASFAGFFAGALWREGFLGGGLLVTVSLVLLEDWAEEPVGVGDATSDLA